MVAHCDTDTGVGRCGSLGWGAVAHWSGAGGSLEWGAVAHWSGVRWLTPTGVGRGGSDWLDRATDNRVVAGSNPTEAVWELPNWQFPLPCFASVFRKRH